MSKMGDSGNPANILLSSVADPEWFIPEPDPVLNFKSSGSRFGSGSNQYYLIIIGNLFKNTLNSIIKKNLPFSISKYRTVLQYTQSRIHRPKNKLFCYLLLHLLLDPCGSGSATLLHTHQRICVFLMAKWANPAFGRERSRHCFGSAYIIMRISDPHHFNTDFGSASF